MEKNEGPGGLWRYSAGMLLNKKSMLCKCHRIFKYLLHRPLKLITLFRCHQLSSNNAYTVQKCAFVECHTPGIIFTSVSIYNTCIILNSFFCT